MAYNQPGGFIPPFGGGYDQQQQYGGYGYGQQQQPPQQYGAYGYGQQQGYPSWDYSQQQQQQGFIPNYQQPQAVGGWDQTRDYHQQQQHYNYQAHPQQGYTPSMTYAQKKANKKGKKEKKDKKKLSKEEKKKLKQQKNAKKKNNKAQVASYVSPVAYNNPNLVSKIKENEGKARIGAAGPGAKTAAEEWATAGKAEGIQIWRIENFCIVPWPREHYGKFFNGDSYIVLNTYKQGNAFRWDIHFWLGEKTSQDEAGTAAYKTVELDDQLGGLPVQHREVQDFESERFLSYFKPSMQILQGGVESGFRIVKPEEYKTRLLQLKGKRMVRVTQVPVDSDSLNSGDVFILDAGLTIYHWNGKSASAPEKLKGGEICRSLRDERKGKPVVITLEEGKEDLKFWELIGGKGPIASAAEGGDDLEAEKESQKTKLLLQLSDASGQLQIVEKARGRVQRNLLNSNDVFIFDTGAEVFAWIGKNASPQEKRAALSYAQDYLVRYNRPPYLPISRMIEGCESQSFITAFDP